MNTIPRIRPLIFSLKKGLMIGFSCLSLVSPAWAQFDNTNVLVEKAVNDIYQKRYEQAHRLLKEAYEQSPRHPGVHFNLARIFELTGNHSEALREYQLAAALDPSMVAARRGIARCSVEMKRIRVETQPRLTETTREQMSAQAAREIPQNRSRAPVVAQQPPRNSESRLSLFNSNDDAPQRLALPPIPVQNPVRTARGTSSPRSVSPQTQIDFPPLTPADPAPQAMAIELPAMPSSPQLPNVETLRVPPLPPEVAQKIRRRQKSSVVSRAESMLSKGDASQAIETLEGSEPDSDSPDVHFLLGKAYGMKGNLFSAIKHLEETVRVDEHYHEAYYLLAQNYAKVNLLDDAIRNYQRYFAVKPQVGIAVEMAKVYERMGKPSEAKEFFAKANAMNPGNPNIQSKLGAAENKMANDTFLRANHALTTKDYAGAISLYQQALAVPGLDATYVKEARRKIEVAKLRVSEAEKVAQPARDGYAAVRRQYATVNLKFSQLAGIGFDTRFTDPITVEWRGQIARIFRRYGRDFLLMIKELSRDELDEMGRDRNDYRLNPNFNNQPLFLLSVKPGELPVFAKQGTMITFTGQTDWKRYDIINELGQTVKLPAFELISAYPR
jgi:tetratricopeptide (TPR) repeat protein